MTNIESFDWRAEFRLHAMDIEIPAEAPQRKSHWMLQDETIREWISDVRREYENLIAAGGDPFRGEPVTLELIVDMLGFAEREKPTGLFAYAKFTAALVAATTRHAAAAQRKVLRLRRSRSANT